MTEKYKVGDKVWTPAFDDRSMSRYGVGHITQVLDEQFDTQTYLVNLQKHHRPEEEGYLFYHNELELISTLSVVGWNK